MAPTKEYLRPRSNDSRVRREDVDTSLSSHGWDTTPAFTKSPDSSGAVLHSRSLESTSLGERPVAREACNQPSAGTEHRALGAIGCWVFIRLVSVVRLKRQARMKERRRLFAERNKRHVKACLCQQQLRLQQEFLSVHCHRVIHNICDGFVRCNRLPQELGPRSHNRVATPSWEVGLLRETAAPKRTSRSGSSSWKISRSRPRVAVEKEITMPAETHHRSSNLADIIMHASHKTVSFSTRTSDDSSGALRCR